MRLNRRLRSRAALAFVMALVGPLALAMPVAAATATTTTLTSDPVDPGAGIAFCLHSSTTLSGGGSPTGGSIEFLDTTPVVPVSLSSHPVGVSGPADATHCITDGVALGVHTYQSIYHPLNPDNFDSSSDDLSLDVGKATPIVWIETNGVIKGNQPFNLYVFISAGSIFGTGGSVSIFRNGVATPLCTFAIVQNGSCSVSLPAATYTLVAKFTGSTTLEAADSQAFELTVPPDTVEASGVGIQYTTFYPKVDGYRDTLQIKGMRIEPIDVVVRIYTPSGSFFKSQTFARGTGAYAMTWNGKYLDGTVRPEGSYKITQTLRDAAGTTKVYTFFVTLSKKKLYTLTKTTTKLGTNTSASGTEGTGTISRNTSTGVLTLRAGSSGFAGAGWQFGLPAATIFKSITFRLYAKHPLSIAAQMGLQNFSWCPYVAGADWDTACADRLRLVGNSANTLAWYSTTGSVTTNRSGAVVRGMISNTGLTAYVYKAQLVVVYQVLKY